MNEWKISESETGKIGEKEVNFRNIQKNESGKIIEEISQKYSQKSVKDSPKSFKNQFLKALKLINSLRKELNEYKRMGKLVQYIAGK